MLLLGGTDGAGFPSGKRCEVRFGLCLVVISVAVAILDGGLNPGLESLYSVVTLPGIDLWYA